MNLFFPNAQGAGETFHGKPIATNLSNAEVISCQHAPDRSGSPMELFGNLLDRALYKLFTNDLNLNLRPAAMFDRGLQTVLDDETPALLFRATRMALKTHDKLLEFIAT
jgi:hypothetical protein